MRFWGDEYFRTLKEIGAEASAVSKWKGYGQFCLQYEHGLRQEAFASLDQFIFSLERAPFDDRRDFVSWLSRRVDMIKDCGRLVPHQLYIRIFEPTLLEWTQIDPECCEPHCWLGGEEHLRRALELAPNDELARKKLIIFTLGRVGFNSHELPAGYLGIAQDDLSALSEAENLLRGLSNQDDRRELYAQIEEERFLIREHLRNRKD